MFGRTGQMFPRRAYHDAIYQEEYGADNSDDCCRSRGLSAVLCWFLSVIILIGLAASVILTVFFILKSRSFVGKSSNGEDLDILYNLNEPTTGEEKDIIHQDGSEEHAVSISPTKMTTTTTRMSSSSSTHRTEIRSPPTIFSFTSPPFLVIKKFNENKEEEKKEEDEMTQDNNNNNNNTVEYISTTPLPPPSIKQINSSTKRVYLSPVRSSTPTVPTTTTTSTTMETTKQIPQQHNWLHTKPSSVHNIFDKLKKFNKEILESSKTSSIEINSNESGGGGEKFYNSPPFLHTSNNHNNNNNDNNNEKSSTESSSHLLFTMPPVKITNYSSSSRRNTRPPPRIKTSYNNPPFPTTSSSASSSSSEYYKDLLSSEKTLLEIKSHVSPTIQVHLNSGHTISVETEFITPRPTTSVLSKELHDRERHDVLSRIIKNLAPKFKNKTTTTTTTTTAGNKNLFSITTRNYLTTIIPTTPSTTPTTTTTTTQEPPQPPPVTWDHIEEESELNLFKEHIIPPRYSSSDSIQPFEIVSPPNFTTTTTTTIYNKNNNDDDDDIFSSTTTENHFLDILVGNEDHKTLITKDTKDGLITSVILPPWFENDTYNGNGTPPLNNLKSNGSINNNSTSSGGIIDDGNNNTTKINNTHVPITSDISNLFFNWFSNSPTTTPYNKSNNNNNNDNKNIKTPTIPTTIKSKGKESEIKKSSSSWRDILKGFTPILPHSTNNNNNTPTKLIPELAKNAFHFGTTDGTSDIYGFYSEDPIVHNIQPMSHHYHHHHHDHGFGDKIHINNDDESSHEDPMVQSPSHIIDIAYDPKEQPEIIIDPSSHDSRKYYNNYGDYMDTIPSGSQIQSQIIIPPPPPPPNNNQKKQQLRPTGAGIRRPMESIESILEDQYGSSSSLKILQNSNENNSNNSTSLINTTTTSPGNITIENKVDQINDLTNPSTSPPDTIGEQQISNDDDNNDDDEDNDYDFYHQQHSHFPTGNASPGDDNDLKKRKPVRQLDLKHYSSPLFSSPRDPTPVHENTDENDKRIFQVYPVSYTTSSSSPPLEPELHEDEVEIDQTLEENNNNNNNNDTNTFIGFVPPKPISFHSNTYNFSPSISTGGFLPLNHHENPDPDNWRPVHYDNIEKRGDDEGKSKNSHNIIYEPPTHRDEIQKFPIINPLYIPTFSPTPSSKTTPSLVVFSTPNSEESGDDDRNIHIWMSSTQDPVTITSSGPILSIKPSEQIPSLINTNSQRIKFPNQQQSSHVPLKNHHMIGPDRNKFQYRPVTPPIVMRRTPQNNLPFLPQRNQLRKNSQNGLPPQQLPPPPRIPPQYINQPHEFKQQQRLKQHLYEQNLMRIQQKRPPPGHGHGPGPGPGNGNIKWPPPPTNEKLQGFDNNRMQQLPFPHLQNNRRIG